MTKIKMMNLCALIAMCMSCPESTEAAWLDGGSSPDPVKEAATFGQQRTMFTPSSSPSSNLGGSSASSCSLSRETVETGSGTPMLPPIFQQPLHLNPPMFGAPMVSLSSTSGIEEEPLQAFHMTSWEIAGLKADIKWLSEMRSALELRDNTISLLVSRVDQLESANAELQMRIGGLEWNQAELAKNKADKKALEHMAGKKEATKLQVAVSPSKLKQTQEDLERQIQERDSKIANLEAQLVQSEEKQSELAAEMNVLREQMKTLSKQKYVTSDQRKKELDELAERITDANGKLNTLQQQRKELDTQSRQLQKQVKGHGVQLSKLQKLWDGCSGAVEELNDTVQSIVEQQDLLQKEIENLQKSVNVLLTDSADNLKMIKDFGSQLDEILTSFREIMQTHKQELKQKEQELAQKDAIIQGQVALLSAASEAVQKLGQNFQEGIQMIWRLFPPAHIQKTSYEAELPLCVRNEQHNLRAMWFLPEDDALCLQNMRCSPYDCLPHVDEKALILWNQPNMSLLPCTSLRQTERLSEGLQKNLFLSTSLTSVCQESSSSSAKKGSSVRDRMRDSTLQLCRDCEKIESFYKKNVMQSANLYKPYLKGKNDLEIAKDLYASLVFSEITAASLVECWLFGGEVFKISFDERIENAKKLILKKLEYNPSPILEALTQQLGKKKRELEELNGFYKLPQDDSRASSSKRIAYFKKLQNSRGLPQKGSIVYIQGMVQAWQKGTEESISALETEIAHIKEMFPNVKIMSAKDSAEAERIKARFPAVKFEPAEDSSVAKAPEEEKNEMDISLLQQRLKIAHEVLGGENLSTEESTSIEGKSKQSVSSWLEGTSADPNKKKDFSKHHKSKHKKRK